MERTLVVVTCYRDLYPLHIMFRSIKKYLEPSKIIIVVNEEDDFKWLVWYDRTKKLLSDHDVKIVYREELLNSDVVAQSHCPNPNGWILQNIFKLIVSGMVETEEYVLLDSKNFFIKTTKLQDIKRQQKVNVFDDIGWDIGWIMAVVSKLSNPALSNLISPMDNQKLLLTSAQTPYIINTSHARQLVEHFGGSDGLSRWFLNTSENLMVCLGCAPPNSNINTFISEFYLYELFCSLELGVEYPDRIKNNTWVLWSTGNRPEWPVMRIPKYIHVAGIHHEYRNESTKLEIDSIYSYFGLDED